MHPAYSIILFSTASGAGYGLLAAAGALAALGLLPADRTLGWLVAGLALALITLGLLASTAHLGRPERAWRAVSQWRSSWLSREGAAALLTYAAALPFAALWAISGQAHHLLTALLGLFSALLAGLTVACTGMIYASLKPIAQWHNRLTLPVYLALSLMTGLLWLAALAGLLGYRWPLLAVAAAVAVALGWTLKEAYWRHIARHPGLSTPETATALGSFGRVRLLERPHTETNYLLREMGYRVARRHARRLRGVTRLLGFLLPLLLTLAAAVLDAQRLLAPAAALSASAGVLVERWLFFAEARHTVMLYYGADAV